MAGKRQHTLPRFLQKGFASNIIAKSNGRETVFTWVYRKGAEPFETKTENVGLEKYFYGKAGEQSVDDDITDLEPAFAAIINESRAKHDGYKISDPNIADFVAHLSIRTKHFRDSFMDMAEALTGALCTFLAEYRNLRWWTLEYHKRHPEVMRKALDDQFKKMGLPRFQRLRALEYATGQLRVEMLASVMDKDQSDYESTFSALGPMLLKMIPSIAKDGHIQALAKSLIPEPRAEDYRSLQWYVCKSSDRLILGDVGCLFEVTGPKQYISLAGKDDELKAIYLPISSDRLVVGSTSTTAPRLDFNKVNEAFAERSRDFFICDTYSEEMGDLQKLLGTKAQILDDDEIKQILIEALNEA